MANRALTYKTAEELSSPASSVLVASSLVVSSPPALTISGN